MNIAIGSDHGGFELKKVLSGFLKENGHSVDDRGTYTPDSCDYPDISYDVAVKVAHRQVDRGVLICKSGIGSNMVANKVPGARAAVCNSLGEATLSREHNDTNIIVFGSKFVSAEEAKKILAVWLITEHLGGRHKRRVDRIGEIERKILEEGK